MTFIGVFGAGLVFLNVFATREGASSSNAVSTRRTETDGRSLSARVTSGRSVRKSSSAKRESEEELAKNFEELRVLLERKSVASLDPTDQERLVSTVRNWFNLSPIETLSAVNSVSWPQNRESVMLILGLDLIEDSSLVEAALAEGFLKERDLLVLGSRLDGHGSPQFVSRFLNLAGGVELDSSTKNRIEKIVIRSLGKNPLPFAVIEQAVATLSAEQRWRFLVRLFDLEPRGSLILQEDYRKLREKCSNEGDIKAVVKAGYYSMIATPVKDPKREPIQILESDYFTPEDVQYLIPLLVDTMASRFGWSETVASIRGAEIYDDSKHASALVGAVIESGNSDVGMQLIADLEPSSADVQRIVSKGAKFYIQEDAAHAARWIEKMDQGKSRQIALREMVSHLKKRGHVEEAAAWEKLIEVN